MELEKLEEDVKLMAQKIAEFNETLPNQLQNTLNSILSAQRHVNLNLSGNGPGSSSSNPNSDSRELEGDDLANVGKLHTIKHMISANEFAMSSQLKRLKDCMSRIDKLDSLNKGIHPAFKRRKITSKDFFM
ncbi:hypothetical protein E3N88_16962 [Mikania micrantha]|uniref:Uncharacterized protein n=1 Tax=Mikania micrantha TaxID=192012 RepID=A0A5N6NQH8_9ASTR|nr:hypothetical protein E3N88_16962 [Mikania micrantha]